MFIRVDLQNVLFRRAFLLIALLSFGLLVKIIVGEFVVGTLSDKRVGVNKDLLISSIGYFPESARLFARLAEIEAAQSDADSETAERHARQAVEISPSDFRHRLLLAEIRDARGDRTGAEQSLNDALRLAPNYSEVHWRAANFLAREGRIEESVEHFRRAADANPALFAATLDLMWTVSDKNIPLLKRIVENNQKGQLKLALLLANQSNMPEAADVFSKVDKSIRLRAWESTSFFDLLINKGFSRLAAELWFQLKSVEGENGNGSLIWNGDFEGENDFDAAQFNWRIGKSDYARIYPDGGAAHSGKRSLVIDFLGRETTKLNNEIRHLIALRPGADYRLDYFVKTEELKIGEGLRVVVTDAAGNRIAQSESISAGNDDWKQMSVNFTAARKTAGAAAAHFISVKLQPRYSYEAPTRGRVRFDDFVVSEVRAK